MKQNNSDREDGFTLMEALLSIAIILILGSVLVTAANTALRGASRSFNEVRTAATFTRIDRHIRENANNLHISYWENPLPRIEDFNAALFRSGIGGYIQSIRIITDNRRKVRGIEVIYIVNYRQSQTVALFPFRVIVDSTQ